MTASILLCTDLDRTLLPNGAQPESPGARALFAALTARPEILVAYVSGRHEALLRAAMAEYGIPRPDFAVGDVGTTIYEVQGEAWRPWRRWHEAIAPDWRGFTRAQLAEMLGGIDGLRLQEAEKQNVFKLSYYAPAAIDPTELLAEVEGRLAAEGIRASLIWSIDEATDVGLLDVLPERATKLHAVAFLIDQLGIDPGRTVFAGDSGNDLPVLTSGLQAVLVANAHPQVRAQALAALEGSGRRDSLYLAQGGLLGMNGNYAAGIVEGLVHFLPEVRGWLPR